MRMDTANRPFWIQTHENIFDMENIGKQMNSGVSN